MIGGICWVGITIECVGDLTLEAADLVSSGGIRHTLLSRFMNNSASDTMQLLVNSKPLQLGAGFASFSVINPQIKNSEALDNNKSSELKIGSDGSSSASDVSSSNVFRMIVVITGDSIVGFESERCFNEINWNDFRQLHIGVMPEIIS